MSFFNLKEGDRFKRHMGHNGPIMEMQVIKTDDTLIHARAVGGPDGYTFDRRTGAEEDEYLQWGIKFGATGTYISKENADAVAKERDTG